MKKRKIGNTSSLPKALTVGVLCSVAVTLVCAVVITFLVSREQIPEQTVSKGAVLASVLSTLLGSGVAVWLLKEKYLLVSLGTAGLYFLCLLTVTVIAFNGSFANVPGIALSAFGGSGVVALLGLRGAGSRGKKRFTYRGR